MSGSGYKPTAIRMGPQATSALPPLGPPGGATSPIRMGPTAPPLQGAPTPITFVIGTVAQNITAGLKAVTELQSDCRIISAEVEAEASSGTTSVTILNATQSTTVMPATAVPNGDVTEVTTALTNTSGTKGDKLQAKVTTGSGATITNAVIRLWVLPFGEFITP